MLNYELEEADLQQAEHSQTENIVLYRHAVSGKGGHGKERAWALGEVAEAMGCETCYRGNDAGNGIRWIQIVGPASTIENLKILLPAVLLQMETGAARAARERAKELPAWLAAHERSRETATVRRSFLRGFGRGINTKLQTARSEYAEELHTRPPRATSVRRAVNSSWSTVPNACSPSSSGSSPSWARPGLPATSISPPSARAWTRARTPIWARARSLNPPGDS